jgi:cysteine desulfurase/selenocysteine lyase
MSMQPATELLPRAARPAVPAASFDVDRVRADFPILRQKAHGKPLIYFDNAATAQKPRAVLDALSHYYTTDNANVHRAVHLLSERATEAYEAARVKVQLFLGAHCLREIVFVRGATEGINLVAQTYGRRHVHAGDEVLVTWMEHHSNIVPWQMLCQEKGAHLRVVPIDDRGELLLDEYERLLGPRTKIVALSHLSNALGTINPVKPMIELAHRRGVPVLLDGAQAVPHLRVDVQDLDCDFYVFSGHKLYGPTGIGALYGKARHLELMPPWQGGGDMISAVSFAKTTYHELPYKFEAGTQHIAGAVGLGAAVDYLTDLGLEVIAAHEHDLLEHATAAVSDIPGVRIIGTAAQKGAVVSFVVDDPPISALDVGTRLDLEGIAVRTGHHCCQPLMERFGIPGTARASFGLYNTTEEIDVFATALRQIVESSIVRVKPAAPAPTRAEPAYPRAVGASPQAVADELAEDFDLFDDWGDRYQYLIELGTKLPPLPDEFRTECNRVRGCQSTVFLTARKRPGSIDVVEFLADSDADIVRGLIALLERVFSGQKACDVVAFDVEGFFTRLGLNSHLSMGRRNGLAAMVQRIRSFAADLLARQQAAS